MKRSGRKRLHGRRGRMPQTRHNLYRSQLEEGWRGTKGSFFLSGREGQNKNKQWGVGRWRAEETLTPQSPRAGHFKRDRQSSIVYKSHCGKKKEKIHHMYVDTRPLHPYVLLLQTVICYKFGSTQFCLCCRPYNFHLLEGRVFSH